MVSVPSLLSLSKNEGAATRAPGHPADDGSLREVPHRRPWPAAGISRLNGAAKASARRLIARCHPERSEDRVFRKTSHSERSAEEISPAVFWSPI